ncbi:D-ribose pyranase [Neobacillus cucumis]|uniref:D-ribose pyranase n=1 Tax=Neobacillus cucumis TaxID=1740721 RepID=UPI002852FB4F|nr:D-ribose pyranase [Neobacillus cucumis]MDR4949593.1 D-ribose pyranase [Neobacillus cucumis]
MLELNVINREIAAEMAKMGHTDMMMIVDAGLAVPNSTKVIDLSLSVGVPTTLEVLDAILQYFSVEKIIYSKATREVSPTREKEFLRRFNENVDVEVIPHDYFRDEMTKKAKFVIRTGDFTANSNIILVSAGGPRWYCEK